MKTQLSISELAAKIEANQQAKKDYVVTTNALELVAYDNTAGDRVEALKIVNGLTETLGTSNHAHDQIASRLDIPRKYYNRLRADAPELLADNVNHWFREKPERRMVRTLDGRARAFLSDRYQRIENEQIAEVALPILGEIPEVRFESAAVTETRMYIKALAPRVQGEVRKGDVVQAGVSISNSEVGAGAVVIQPLIFRLVCLNGMILPDTKFRAHHVGARVGNDEKIAHMLSDEAVAADDHAILLKVRDVLRAAVSEEYFAGALERLQGATRDRIEGDVPAAVEVLAKKASMTEGESSGVLRHLIEGGDLSRYGLLNAVTRHSQDVDDYDRATELEQLGGRILELPRSDWCDIAQAA